MDSFTTFEFSIIPTEEIPTFSASRSEDDIMKELINADTKVGYGGYCVIA
uniref:Mating-type protein phb1 n=1 Tax=Hypsizygus marmoreus TaxID=39966 RepID=A0A7T7DKH0_HYPMA|nr:mating-type protein phb1 [Hypsizygus marmoreus]